MGYGPFAEKEESILNEHVARAALRFSKDMIFVALTGTVMVQAAKEVGVRYVEEV